jgi:Domain of unknown function (DUF4389)
MEEITRQRLIRSKIWIRGLYMLIFVIAYSIAKLIIVFLVIFQFLAILFTGRANEPLLQFGKNLSVYFLEILEFQTFNTELRPFPFSPWPDEEPGGEEWLDETDSDTDDEVVPGEMTAEQDDAEDEQEDPAADSQDGGKK